MKDNEIELLLQFIKKKVEGMSIDEISAKSGVSKSAVKAALESGANTQPRTLKKLIDALGITDEEIENL